MSKRISKLINGLVIMALLFSLGAFDAQTVSAWFQNPFENTGIYRARLALPNRAAPERLQSLGVLILEQGPDWASVLVDQDQLQTLARLRFQPTGIDDLGTLAQSAGLDWLAASLNISIQTAANGEQPSAQGTAALKAMLSPDQQLALSRSPSADDDGDGLSNTEEQWWCTDPANPNTDGDANGYTDGQEVTALLDFTQPRSLRWGYGPPFGPPNSWPAFNQAGGCNDGDYDTIPDYAEIYMVGSSPLEESTDRDKFDDGQELFGVTYCPGGVTSCGHGSYPRQEYWSFIKASMPNWVLPPGDNIFVAAFPVPEVSVVPGSWTVERVTTITTEQGQMTQASHSYETSVMQGQSTSIANTVTWNEWEEVSQSIETPMIFASGPSISPNQPSVNWAKFRAGSARFVGGTLLGAAMCAGTFGPGCIVGAVVGSAFANSGWDLLKEGWAENPDGTTKDDSQNQQNTNHYPEHPYCSINKTSLNSSNGSCLSPSTDTNSESQNTIDSDSQGINNGVDNIQYATNNQGQLLERGLFDISYQLSRPRFTETNTSGRSWGGAQTVTSETYEEHTISEGQAFTTGENWSTAWAVDSSHAADLTFNYTVQNTGTEYARELTGLVFNIYLGDDPNPMISYLAWQQFPNGKLENIFPGDDPINFASTLIPLTLEQMRRIDLGERLTVVLEDYSYGADELFYQDAVNGAVTFFVEDGVEDGDESVDLYVVPTWGTENVQDVFTRYFPSDVDSEGNLNGLWTPEFDGINPPAWNEHFLSEIAWWNVYLTQADAGNTPLHQLSAQAGSALLFRFNRDSDRDGYQDRVEMKYYCALPSTEPDYLYCGAEPDDAQFRPEIHPNPEVLAGYVEKQQGNQVTVTLKIANLGTFDAYGIDAVMYAPDATTTIGNNTIGGNGRVRAGDQVAVGSLVLPPALDNWTNSTSKTYAAGYYLGDADTLYTFTVSAPGVVGQGSTALDWANSAGGSGTLDLGLNYHAPLPVDVSQGLQMGFDTGTAMAGESFTVQALTPRDTFTYTINAPDYTPPVIVVSYSDPQGSHRFVTPVKLNSMMDDLATHGGEMLNNPVLEISTLAPVDPLGTNTTNFTINSPHPEPIVDANLYLNFVADGDLVAVLTDTLTLEPGPTVIPVEWSTAIFSHTYDAAADNILIVFWTDAQNNIIDSAARPLVSFQDDPEPNLATDAASLDWDFGTVNQGDVLNHQIPLANIGFTPLYYYISETIQTSGPVLFTLEGSGSMDSFGQAVSSAGDVDGDSFPDILVGAPFADPSGQTDAGSAYLFSGQDGSLICRYDGEAAGDYLAIRAIAGIGDVGTQDGKDDVLTGAYAADPGGRSEAGKAYVFRGTDCQSIFTPYEGVAVGDRFGYAASPIDDLNNDGRGDFLVGAPNYQWPNYPGSVFAYSGSDGAPLFRIDNPVNQDSHFGSTIANAGDVNGDGLPDIIVAAYAHRNPYSEQGAVFIYSGADRSILWQAYGEHEFDQFGNNITSLSDWNGDGKPDVVVGAHYTDANGYADSGSVYVYSGADGALLHRFDGENAGHHFGESVGAADVDGDGTKELIVGTQVGIVYIFDSDGSLIRRIDGQGSLYNLFGQSVAGLGDLNGDGKEEFIVGAPADDPPGLSNAGMAYIFSGNTQSPGQTGTRTNAGKLLPADLVTYNFLLDTSSLPVGPYAHTISIRTSDPNQPEIEALIHGTINPAAAQSRTVNTPNALPDLSITSPDITFGGQNPHEGDIVPVNALIHNTGSQDSGPATVAFFATYPGLNEVYIGSAFIPSIPAAGAEQVTVQWDTLYFFGDVPVRVVADPYDRLNEVDPNNNQATATINILSRPDLEIVSIVPDGSIRLSIPVNIDVTVRNNGDTPVTSQDISLYLGDPNSGGQIITSQSGPVDAGGTANLRLAWIPDQLGPLTLYAQADSEQAVSEYDESNNTMSQSVYAGWGPPVYIDAGSVSDLAYSSPVGYGYVTPGSVINTCGSEPHQTYRQMNSGEQLQYQYDYLLPERFYHLDMAFYLCSGSRELRVLVDGVEAKSGIAASSSGPTYVSLLLDPSQYNDHGVVVSVEKMGGGLGGPVVSQLMLTDIRYCYRDSGADLEVSYANASDGCGWENGTQDQSWGTQPYQSVRYDDTGEVRYRFDQMEAGKDYYLNLTFFEGDGTGRVQDALADGSLLVDNLMLSDTSQFRRVDIPASTYADGYILAAIQNTGQAVISEISLEQKTLSETGIEPPANADLGLTISDTPDPVASGDNLTYQLTLSNAGPEAAKNIAASTTLPTGVSLVSATGTQGAVCSGSGPVVCSLANLASGASATITVVVEVTAAAGSVLTAQAYVSGNISDSNLANNSASVQTTVIEKPGGAIIYLPAISKQTVAR